MAVSLLDVAKAAKVSVSTAHRALTHSDHAVSQETRERILKVAAELSYKPNMLASGLRRGRSFSLGIVIDSITGPFTPFIVRSIQDLLKKEGYSCIIVNSDNDPAAEVEAMRVLLSRQVDGIIFIDTNVHSVNQILHQTKKPLIFIKRRSTTASQNCISVLPDNRYGGRLATQHLVQLGHTRIAHITGPVDWDASILREEGYTEVLEANHIPIEASLIAHGNWQADGGARAMERILSVPVFPTAVFVANDEMAIGAIYAAQDHGLKIPEDLAVVGFDDLAYASFMRPSLTTVRQPLHNMGNTAVSVMMDQLEGKPINQMTFEVKGELIIRQSCGAKTA